MILAKAGAGIRFNEHMEGEIEADFLSLAARRI
jgi:hypothetical protein